MEGKGLHSTNDRGHGRGGNEHGVINNTKEFRKSSYEKLPL